MFTQTLQISGLGILIVGIVVLTDVHEFDYFTEGRTMGPPIVLIVAGALVFLIASLGCYGAMKESPTLLMVYAVCLLIIVIVEVAVGIASWVMKSDMEMILNDSLKRSIIRSSNEDIIAWDNVQRKLMCCGVNGPADWIDLSDNKTLRGSCCLIDYIDPATRDCKLAYPLFKDKYYQVRLITKFSEKLIYAFSYITFLTSDYFQCFLSHKHETPNIHICSLNTKQKL